MKNKIGTMLATLALTAVTVAAVGLTACGSSKAEGTASIDVTTTATYGMLNSQVSSMLGFQSTVEIVVEDNTYTMTKKCFSEGTEFSNGARPASVMTFTGEAKSEGNNVYVLSPATACTYDLTSLAEAYQDAPFGNFILKGEENMDSLKTGTEATYAKILNCFYTPYFIDTVDFEYEGLSNPNNTKTMKVTINGNTLTFDGFTLSEDDE